MKNLLLTCFLLFSYMSLSAHGVCVADADNSRYLRLMRSNVDVIVNNQIATVTSRQVFLNDGCDYVKVKYAFPLPVSANPIYFRYRLQGEDWTEAVFNSAGQDTGLPGSGNIGGPGNNNGSASASLDRYLGDAPFFFTFQNGVPQDQTIEIEIIYVQLLSYEFGVVGFDYPNDYTAIQSQVAVWEFNLELKSDRDITSLESLNHNSEYDMGPNLSTLHMSDENVRIDTDIEVNYSLLSDDLGSYAMSTMLPDSIMYCDEFGGGFLTMILEPESNEDTEVIEKNFVLVIDRSGSMSGSKIIQAKEAAEFIVDNLNDGDNFNIVDFSSTVKAYSNELVEASDKSRVLAKEYIANIYAGGTTNISGSLENAIENFGGLDTTKANIIIFFTDGQATTGIEDQAGIIEHVNNTVNQVETGIFLFTFGIGDDVNKGLLTSLAVENSGLVSFLENQELEAEITSFFLKINNPVLINTTIDFQPDVITEVYPDPVPNLYEGQQLILSGRYKEPAIVNMTLRGQFYNSVVEYNFPINLTDSLNPQLSVLPQIWAKQKVDDLAIDFYLSSGPAADLIQHDIDSIGSCYGVVNVEFNSFSDGPLEIDYLDFKLHAQNDQSVMVKWSTIAEVNNDKFIVQRSCDAKDWKDIHEVEGQGNSSELTRYEYLDREPCADISYYRLVTVDLSGEISYSEIKAIKLNQTEEITLFPNPIKSGDYIFLSSQIDEELDFRLYSVDGKLLIERKVAGVDGFPLVGLEQGTYIVILTSGDIRKVEQIIVK